MILSDKYRFVFVHIPKCAGTSVRKQIEAFDDTGGKYFPEVREYHSYGQVDVTHIPLSMLSKTDPADFKRVVDYRAFAVVRNPKDRFFSALAQRLKMYEKVEIAQLEAAQIIDFALKTIEALELLKREFSYEFIHFTPQSEFLFHDEKKVVECIYPIENVSFLLEDIGRITGKKLNSYQVSNATQVFKQPGLKNIALSGKRLVDSVFPSSISEQLRRYARRQLLTPTNHLHQNYAKHPEVNEFIMSYYSLDFDVYSDAIGGH